MDEFVGRFLAEQRNRAVGSIMGHIEREVYPLLPPEKRSALRAKVLSAVGVYHDASRDMLKASIPSDTVIINTHALELIEQLHAASQRE